MTRANGRIIPRELVEDGRRYAVDRVLDIRPSAAMKAGGSGDRYTIQVKGKQSYLFFERNASIRETILGDGLWKEGEYKEIRIKASTANIRVGVILMDKG